MSAVETASRDRQHRAACVEQDALGRCRPSGACPPGPRLRQDVRLRFCRRLADQVAPTREVLGEELLPGSRLHHLRHTHATLLLDAGEPVKVVPADFVATPPEGSGPGRSRITGMGWMRSSA